MKTLFKSILIALLFTIAVLPQKKFSVSLDGKSWKGELHSAQLTKLFGKSFLKLHFIFGREEISVEIDMANLNGKKDASLTYKPMKRLSDPSPAFTVSYFENEVNKWSAASGSLQVTNFDQAKKTLSGELDATLEKKGAGGSKMVKLSFSNIIYLE